MPPTSSQPFDPDDLKNDRNADGFRICFADLTTGGREIGPLHISDGACTPPHLIRQITGRMRHFRDRAALKSTN